MFPDARRRRLLKAMTALPVAAVGSGAQAAPLLRWRTIPGSGELLPVVGLGTYMSFDFPRGSRQDMANGMGSLLAFLKGGGRLIDASPMYGEAEARVGEGLRYINRQEKPFFATKVWTQGEVAGKAQMERSRKFLGCERIDLMQIHNLVDAATHRRTLQAWKEAGRIRYMGITHYHAGAYPEVEAWLRNGGFDFLQINYSLQEREAENRLLPYCRDNGIAVIINRPFAQGSLFEAVRARALPAWAADIDCASWGQLFLKWILSNPAVTCVIPASRHPLHVEDNLGAGIGALPDAAMRRKIAAALES